MCVYQGGRILQSLAKKVRPNSGPLPERQNNITEAQVLYQRNFIKNIGRYWKVCSWRTVSTSEYKMIYGGPGFLAVMWFGSSSAIYDLSLLDSCQSARPASSDSKETKNERQLADGRGSGQWWGRNLILRGRESLVLYKSFNTLWFLHTYLGAVGRVQEVDVQTFPASSFKHVPATRVQYISRKLL
jgi:hypothetical protein